MRCYLHAFRTHCFGNTGDGALDNRSGRFGSYIAGSKSGAACRNDKVGAAFIGYIRHCLLQRFVVVGEHYRSGNLISLTGEHFGYYRAAYIFTQALKAPV